MRARTGTDLSGKGSAEVEQHRVGRLGVLRHAGLVDPGADAATLEENVTSIIEQEMNGVENFLYMSSSSAANGSS